MCPNLMHKEEPMFSSTIFVASLQCQKIGAFTKNGRRNNMSHEARLEIFPLGRLEELQETNRRYEAFDVDKYLQSITSAQAEVGNQFFLVKLSFRTQFDVSKAMIKFVNEKTAVLRSFS